MKIVVAAMCAWTMLGATVDAQHVDIGQPPGRLIDAGDRKLHLFCSGSGAPTVILEAGASSFAIDWSLVQPEVARTNRVCSYDRARHGWSDPRREVETPARIAQDLNALLNKAGEKPPYILVGASFGGIYTRLYQLDHPADIAGLVLVDPTTEDRLFTMYQGEVVTIATLTAEQQRSILPQSGSIPIPTRSPQTGAPFDKLPPELYQLRIKLDQRLIGSMPASLDASVVQESVEGQRAALARLYQSRSSTDAPIRNTPLIVLTRGQNMSNGLAENHAALARLSTNSRQTVVQDSGHEVHLFTPAAVIQAIQDVATAARQRSRLPVR